MTCRSLAHIDNVVVTDLAHYGISAEAFPRYFLRFNDDAEAIRCAIEAELFARHIAAPFHIIRRLWVRTLWIPQPAMITESCNRT